MKLFKNIQTKKYSTPIGELNISNFYNFYRKNFINKNTSSIQIDNKTTLVEAAINIYSDPNMIWGIVFSNNKINPFTLTKTNATNYLNNTSSLVSFNPNAIDSGYYSSGMTFSVPSGSILTNYAENTGASWSYSSVGNFDLNGPFALVDSSSYYSLSVNLKETKNKTNGNMVTANVDDGGTFSFIYKGDTYYKFNNKVTNKNTKEFSKSIVKEISKDKSKEVLAPAGSKNTDSKEFTFMEESKTDYISVEENIKNESKTISFIVLQDFSSSLSSLIVPKYSIL